MSPFAHVVIGYAAGAGVLPLQLQAAYSAAKAGLINLTQSMALELGKQVRAAAAAAAATTAAASTFCSHPISSLEPEKLGGWTAL